MDEPSLRSAVPARTGLRAPRGAGTCHEGHAEAHVDGARLARVAQEVAAEWHVPLGTPFALSRYSFVAPAGDGAVLKVVPPEDDESTYEAEALVLWNGDGAVRLLRHDRARRALLLERAMPGHDASRLADDGLLAVAHEVASRLWRRVPPDAPYERITERVPAWLDHAGSDDVVDRARKIYASLGVSAETLVHGDFHQHNLLRHGGRWVAIDPKPMLGEPEFDVATLLWNPIGSTVTRERVEHVIAAFAARGLDPARMRAWGIIRGAYLSAPGPDGRTHAQQLAVARMLLGG